MVRQFRIVAALVALALAGCGIKGPLYLPPPAPPAAAPAAPSSPPAVNPGAAEKRP